MAEQPTKAPVVLNKLADLTCIRDTEIFEISVLKTLAQLLKTNEISLYRLDTANQPTHLIRFQEQMQNSGNSMIRTEISEYQLADIEIPGFIKTAQRWIDSGHAYYLTQDGGFFIHVYPVVGAVRTVGFIATKTANKLSETESLVIKSILAITHNFHMLLEDNQRDKLTGLLNRKTFEETFNKLVSSSAFNLTADAPESFHQEQRSRSSEQNWLAIMDIDHFKRINDTWGHIFGDEVLLLIAHIMRDTFRKIDFLFRFGGEEFVVILRNLDKNAAERVLDRFRNTVAGFRFPQIDRVTISIGATEIVDQLHVPADIVGRADQALYHAKAQGRNQLFFYEDLVYDKTIVPTIEGSIDLF